MRTQKMIHFLSLLLLLVLSLNNLQQMINLVILLILMSFPTKNHKKRLLLKIKSQNNK